MSASNFVDIGETINYFSDVYKTYIRTFTFVDSVPVQNPDIVKLDLIGSLQEVDGETLELFPSGSTIKESKVIYSTDILPVDDAQYSGDLYFVTIAVDIDDRTRRLYRIVGREIWNSNYSMYKLVQLRDNNEIPEGNTYVEFDVTPFDSGFSFSPTGNAPSISTPPSLIRIK